MSRVVGTKCDMCGNVWDDLDDDDSCTLCARRSPDGTWSETNLDGSGTHICMPCAAEVCEMLRKARGER